MNLQCQIPIYFSNRTPPPLYNVGFPPVSGQKYVLFIVLFYVVPTFLIGLKTRQHLTRVSHRVVYRRKPV